MPARAAMTRSSHAPPHPHPHPHSPSPFAIRHSPLAPHPHPQLACASPSVILSDPDRRPALDRRRMGVARLGPVLAARRARGRERLPSADDAARCPAAAGAQPRHQGRLRGGRLRRLHGGARTGQGQAAAVRAVNACILLLGQADGAEIVTVEGPRRGGPAPRPGRHGPASRLAVRLLHARDR